MDKLEPILKQKFWILLGVGVIMTLTGWWMASGALAKTITERKTTLDGLEKVIPSGETPNDDWSKKLAEINVVQERLVDVARLEMWNRQKARMFWPPDVEDYAKQIPYEGEFDVTASNLYRARYPDEVVRIWKISRPYLPMDGTGIVHFPIEKFPKQSDVLAPTSKEMWERQQDLWLLESLMEAIRNVNGGEEGTRLDARIHIIERLELMGGDRSKLGGAGTTDSMSMSSSSGEMSADSGAMSLSALGGGFAGGGYGGAAGAAAPASSEFDPKEEYGDGGTLNAGGFGGFGGGSQAFSMPTDSADSPSATTDTASTAPVIRRYVDDDAALPYKTRAFYMTVIMDHREVPKLLAELTANGESAWPIEINRVQVTRVNPDDGQTGTGLSTGLASSSSAYPNSSSQYGGSSSSPYAGAGGSFSLGSSAAYMPTAGDSSESYDGAGGYGGMARPAGAGFESILADPFLARVSMCGLIYIYNLVDPPATPAPETTAPATETPVTDPNALSPGNADPSTTPDPADAPADPNAPQPTPATTTEPEATTTPETTPPESTPPDTAPPQ